MVSLANRLAEPTPRQAMTERPGFVTKSRSDRGSGSIAMDMRVWEASSTGCRASPVQRAETRHPRIEAFSWNSWYTLAFC